MRHVQARVMYLHQLYSDSSQSLAFDFLKQCERSYSHALYKMEYN